VENVPDTCCSRNGNDPTAVARAKHGGDYRPCWCRGDIERHRVEISPAAVALIPDLTDEEDDSEE
jgi:hypothetical protein